MSVSQETFSVARYIGLEYSNRGRGPTFDCWGLVQLVYRQEFGISLPGYDGSYTASNDRESVSELVAREIGAWRPVKDIEAGDLLILTIGGRPCHCGVAVDEQRMLHTLRGHAAVVERVDSWRWARRLEGAYRHVARS